jgi:Skp family chaperone for outer membrane proteins
MVVKNPISALNVPGEKLARRSLFLAAAAGVAAAQTPAPPAAAIPSGIKIGVIQAEAALLQTKDGQAAKVDMDKKFGPKQEKLQKAKNDIDDLQNRLQRGGTTMSDATKADLQRQIQTNTTRLQRDAQDFQDEQQAEEQKVIAELEEKMKAVIYKFAADNGLSLILNVSAENSPVLYVASSLDITQAIVEAYDKTYPSAAPKAPAVSNTKPPPAAQPPAKPAPGPAAPPKPPAAAPK